MIVNMFQRLENRMEKMQGTFNTVNTITKDIEEIKNKQTEMNNTITEIKNTLEGTNSRITEAEEEICELEDRMVEKNAEEQNKGKGMKRSEDSLRDLWDNINCPNLQIYRGPRRRRGKEKCMRKFLKKL